MEEAFQTVSQGHALLLTEACSCYDLARFGYWPQLGSSLCYLIRCSEELGQSEELVSRPEI
jgi:hypothetical protein